LFSNVGCLVMSFLVLNIVEVFLLWIVARSFNVTSYKSIVCFIALYPIKDPHRIYISHFTSAIHELITPTPHCDID